MRIVDHTVSVVLVLGISLVVGCSSGGSDTPPATTSNQSQSAALAANAGPDQSVFLGTLVTLDGTKSTNANGAALTYTWTLNRPSGSNATLSNPNSVNPSFTIDVGGTYEASLVVRDGSLSSQPDTVLILAAATNPPPAANAGADQSVVFGRAVTLNGDNSRDANGDLLTFRWEVVGKPPGSTLTTDKISLRETVAPIFTPDVTGVYEIRLIVNDGTSDSPPDSVLVTAENKPAPTAEAGLPQFIAPKLNEATQVTLDGSGSHSNPTGEALNFSWSIQPQGASPAPSAQTGLNTTAPTFTIAANRVGKYLATLIVTESNHPDPARRTSTDTVLIQVLPKANAGPPQTVKVGSDVQLDGTQSIGANSFSWTTAPGSLPITFSTSQTIPNPKFRASAEGTYTARLTITDILQNSDVATVSIQAKRGPIIERVTVQPVNTSPYAANQGPVTVILSGATNPSWSLTTAQFVRRVPPAAATATLTATISGVTGTPSCKWTPTNLVTSVSCTATSATATVSTTQAGSHSIALEIDDAADGVAPSSQPFLIRVGTPPTVTITPPTANQGVCSAITLTGSATDGDGDTLGTPQWSIILPPSQMNNTPQGLVTYSSKVTESNLSVKTRHPDQFADPANPAFFTGVNTLTRTFMPDLAGVYTVNFSVTESKAGGITSTAQATITGEDSYTLGFTTAPPFPRIPIVLRDVYNSSASANCGSCHSLFIWGNTNAVTGATDHSGLGLRVRSKLTGGLSNFTPHSFNLSNDQLRDLCVLFNDINH